MKNIRTYNKMVREMKTGEMIYCNAISFSMAMIEQLRSDIKNKILAPVEEELEMVIKEESRDKFRTGESICPQMTYIKL